MKFSDAHGGFTVYSTLAGSFGKLTSAAAGLGTDCPYVGSYTLADLADFPDACFSQAVLLGGDTFDAKEDGSKCYIKRCGDLSDLKFTDKHGGYDTYTLLNGHDFTQIGMVQDGHSTDCQYLGSIEVPDAAAQFPAFCASGTFAMGGDTFDSVDGSKCYVKRCGSFQDLKFTDKYGGQMSFTRLGGRWSQISRAAGGQQVRCAAVGEHAVQDSADLLPACMARALIAGGDTFAVASGSSSCSLKKCRAYEDMEFTAADSGTDTFTMLIGGWSKMTDAVDGVSTDCDYLGSYVPDAGGYPLGCFSQAAAMGGDTFDAKPDGSKCYIKRCGSFGGIKFTANFGASHTFTLLFPRGSVGWGPCPPGSCHELTVLITAALDGRVLPVGGATETCDPDAASGCFGGTARRIGFIDQQRRKHALKNQSVFVVDVGGSAFGGPLYGTPGYPVGMPETMLMNMVPYDVCVFSPRDFLHGETGNARAEVPLSFMNRSCPFVMANAVFENEWSAFNGKQAPFVVKTTLDGLKVGFTGMFPRGSELGYGYGPSVITLDQGSLLADIFAGSFPRLALSRETLADAATGGPTEQHAADVLALSTLVPVDVLVAAAAARRAHPELGPLLLLVGADHREDQVRWLAEQGPFDIIFREKDPLGVYPQVFQNKVTHRAVLVVGGRTPFGMGSLKVRFETGLGVTKFDYRSDVPLDSSIPANPQAQAVMSELYEALRERNARPFGTISNPVVGVHRIDEYPPSKYQCYYTDCNAGTVIGQALLDQARRSGYRVDVSLSNLGGFRQALRGTLGDDNVTDGTVFINHCINTLKFQNPLFVYSILGADLYDSIKMLMLNEERGLISAGVRIAFHEPCHRFVDHNVYSESIPEAPGTNEEIQACLNDPTANVSDASIAIIDLEIAHIDFEKCSDWTDCEFVEWRRLEKGTTYTLVSTSYLEGILKGFMRTNSALPNEPEALCNYISAHSPLAVDPWSDFHERGLKQYSSPEEGWDDGARIASVELSVSRIDDAPTCPGGMFLPRRGSACEQCPSGTRSVLGAARDSCDMCTLGFYSSRDGQALCDPCPKGMFAGDYGSTACTACPPGTFGDTAAIYCNRCQPGFVAPERQSSTCTPCSVATFNSDSAAAVCTPCPDGRVTERRASTSERECVCPAGFFSTNSSASCAVCPVGMDCPLGSVGDFTAGSEHTTPVLRPGYMSLAEDPFVVYRCKSAVPCPGGLPGHCGSLHDETSVACGLCSRGAYRSDEGCTSCSGMSAAPLFIAVTIAIVCIVTAVILMNRDLIRQSHGSIEVVVLAGLTVSTLQAFGTFDQLSVQWMEPVDRVMRTCSMLSFDVKFLQVPCVFPSGPVAVYVATQLVPWACCGLILLTTLLRRLRRRRVDVLAETVNSIGAIGQALFISIAFACLRPLVCYEHPSGKLSVMSAPSVLCFASPGHRLMLAAGIFSFLTLPFPFLVVAIVATAKYTSMITQGSGLRFLRASRFLFAKFRPQAYFYSCVLYARSLALCLVPVCLPDRPAVQILVVVAILCTFLLGQQTIRPWRSTRTNVCDGSLTCLMILLVVSCSNQESVFDSRGMRAIRTGVVIMIFACMCIPLIIATIARITPTVKYSNFICHHKADAGAQARLLKLLLDRRARRRAFIDSDHLQDLDVLFDIVKNKTGQLIVYLTRQTLSRPWCACEITTAHACKVPTIAVHTSSYQAPSSKQLANVHSVVDLSTFNPTTYGMSAECIAASLFWFVVENSDVVTLNPGLIMKERLESAVARLTSSRPGPKVQALVSTMSSLRPAAALSTAPELHGPGHVYVSVDHADDEAAAGACVLVEYTRQQVFLTTGASMCILEEDDCRGAGFKDLIFRTKALIIILSAGTLTSSGQLSAIYEGMRARSKADAVVIPVSTPRFPFPTQQFLEKHLPPEYAQSNKKAQVIKLFKLIACPLALHESHNTLQTHCNAVIARIPRATRHSGMVNHHTSDDTTVRVLSVGIEEVSEEKSSDVIEHPLQWESDDEFN